MCISEKVNKAKNKLLGAAVILFGISGWLIGLKLDLNFLGLSFLSPDFSSADTEICLSGDYSDSYLILKPNLDNGYVSANLLTSVVAEPEEQEEIIEENDDLVVLYENSLVSQAMPLTVQSENSPRKEIITYTVQPGDIPLTIAAKFGLSLNTLLWANNLTEYSIIRPGDELIILPVDGVLHRVKSGQTISWIAKYYKADPKKIIAFNNLSEDEPLQIGQKIIVPGGRKPIVRNYSRRISSRSSRRVSVIGPGTGKSHRFPYGQCTWYVAQKRYIPWSGHAKYWLAQARRYGFKTGRVPRVGAIMVTRESWYGHVAYVEAVKGNWVTISEMNHLGVGVKSVRTLHINDPIIRGYIY